MEPVPLGSLNRDWRSSSRSFPFYRRLRDRQTDRNMDKCFIHFVRNFNLRKLAIFYAINILKWVKFGFSEISDVDFKYVPSQLLFCILLVCHELFVLFYFFVQWTLFNVILLGQTIIDYINWMIKLHLLAFLLITFFIFFAYFFLNKNEI